VRELRGQLSSDRVLFAAIQVFAVDDRSSESGRRDKFLFLTFIGSKVSVMQKARVSVQRGQVLKNFPVGCRGVSQSVGSCGVHGNCRPVQSVGHVAFVARRVVSVSVCMSSVYV
jgi:Cofilin/tropomyosin-type actin-binding protein